MWLSCVKERFPIKMQRHAKRRGRERGFAGITVYFAYCDVHLLTYKSARNLVVAYIGDYRVACVARAVNYFIVSGPVGAHFPVRFLLGSGKYFIFSFSD